MTEHLTDTEIWNIAGQQASRVIDYDFSGKPITEADVMLMGAFGPLVKRVCNAAVDHFLKKGLAEAERKAVEAEKEAAELRLRVHSLTTRLKVITRMLNEELEKRELGPT